MYDVKKNSTRKQDKEEKLTSFALYALSLKRSGKHIAKES